MDQKRRWAYELFDDDYLLFVGTIPPPEVGSDTNMLSIGYGDLLDPANVDIGNKELSSTIMV